MLHNLTKQKDKLLIFVKICQSLYKLIFDRPIVESRKNTNGL
jgi:hypothetical protein